MSSALILGSGLIGTSLGLALSTAGWTVHLDDVDPEHLRIAVERGAGTAWRSGPVPAKPVDVVVAAGPPGALAGQLAEAQRLRLGRTYTHVGSVQSQVQHQVEILNCELSSVVGSHPLAGRELSGPTGALGDLFVGRSWALCPSPSSSAAALEAVTALALACGAVPLVVAPAEHDRSVALLSHLPQVVASVLAAQLVGHGPGSRGAGIVAGLSGTGLADTTRLAAGSPELWTDILCANAQEVAPVVRALAEDLIAMASALEVLATPEHLAPDHLATPQHLGTASDESPEPTTRLAARDVVTAALRRGTQGRATVAVKRGVREDGFARVGVEVDDRPGRLAALLLDAGQAGTNVEDVRVDHVPGRPTGVIELLVDRDAELPLRRALQASGWRVLPATPGPAQADPK